MRIKRSLSAIITTLLIAALPLAASAQVSVGIGVGVGFNIGVPPPPLPVYSVPPAPYPNYMWTPGYWAWGPAGYYWVPGTWVAPPSVGLYWTPGYWGYANGAYAWNAGYWGPSVGFYGGINYGYGYYGTGFVGGFWSGGAFNYNTAVLPVNQTVIHNTYINKTVINKGAVCGSNCHAAFNGGHGGISARPTAAQLDARHRAVPETSVQRMHEREAASDRALSANVNHGHPPITAVDKPITNAKSMPHFAPVTASDKQTAQAQVKHGNVSAPARNEGGAAHNAMMEKPHTSTATHQQNAPVSHPKEKQPPTSTKGNQPPSNAGTMHGSTHMQNGGMYGGHQPSGTMQEHSNQGKPPSGSANNKPPSGSANNKPPSGNDKNKPPPRR